MSGSKLEYYSLIDFSKKSDYEFTKEIDKEIDLNNYYEISSFKEFEEIHFQKRRELKISLILDDL